MRTAHQKLTRHNVLLRPGDFDFLKQKYSGQGIYVAQVIRKLVANHVDSVREGWTPAIQVDLEE